jgi:DNA mismatch repair protein MutS
VAQLAGLPKAVIHRAEEILKQLEEEQPGRKNGVAKGPVDPQSLQLSIFGRSSDIEAELKKLDIDAMSPIEAINKLYELKKKAGDGQGNSK